MAKKDLFNARMQKADEFYTQLSDIEKELKHYKSQFKGKVVFCNCDDPENSNFYYYFVSNFLEIGLKKLITTHFELDKQSYMLEYEGGADVEGDKNTVIKRAIKLGKKSKLKQNFQQGEQADLFDLEPIRSYSGDFRSPECIELLKESDIVVTNPPFSLFREYVALLMQYKKKFLIIGNTNALTYKEIFKLIKEDKLRTGYTNFNVGMYFFVPEYWEKYHKIISGQKMVRVSTSCWFTNLNVTKHNQELILYKSYTPKEYPKYYNYDAIEVPTYKDIPYDYDGDMGVPITFVDKYNPEQFEIIGLGIATSGLEIGVKPYTEKHKKFRKEVQKRGTVDGDLYMVKNGEVEVPYARIIIKKRQITKRKKK